MISSNIATALRKIAAPLVVPALALSVLAGPAPAQEAPPPLDNAPDNTPPTVQVVSPTGGGIAQPADSVTATFSEPMRPETVNNTTFTLTRGDAEPAAADVGYGGPPDDPTNDAVLDPRSPLVQGATYTARIAGAADVAGNVLDQDPTTGGDQAKTWTFRVADVENPTVALTRPQPGPAPGGPEVGPSMPVEATASDNVGVSRVEFFVDGVSRATDNEAPYSADLSMANYAHGSAHTVEARAFDAADRQAVSATANVTVDLRVGLTLGDEPPQDGFVKAAPAPLPFTADTDVVKRECRVDAGAFAPCSSPFAPTLGGDGPHTYEVRVTDNVGNQETLSRSFTLDRTAPNLDISGGPDGATFGPNSTQTWTFTAGDATSGPARVECSVVGVGSQPDYGPCSGAGSHSVSNRPDGPYEFRVRATDGAGNRRELTRTFRIDATKPTATLTSPVGGQKVGQKMTLDFSAADDLTGSPRVEFLVDGAVRAPVPDTRTATSATLDMQVYEHDSTHTVAVRATDGVGNQSPLAEANVTVDKQVSLSLGEAPAQGSFTNADSAPLSFTADADVKLPGGKEECRVLPDAFAPCSSPFDPALGADGAYTYEVKVTDDVGNTASRQRTFRLDRTRPTLAITRGPGNEVFGPNTTQEWAFQAADATSGVAGVECSVAVAGSQPDYGPCKTSGSHSVTGKPDGSYEFRVRATDGAGNTVEAVPRLFTIDATPPGVRIDSGLAGFARTNRSSLTWTFSAVEAGSTFECRSYPGSLYPRPDFGPCSGGNRHTVGRLSAGSYVFEVRARDALGNVDGRPLARSFTVDTGPPRILRVSPAANARAFAPSANITTVFSEKMLPYTVNGLSFKLIRSGTARPVGARVTLNQTTNTATLNPVRPLVRGATYRAVVTTGARDLAGNPLAVGKFWTFRVA